MKAYQLPLLLSALLLTACGGSNSDTETALEQAPVEQAPVDPVTPTDPITPTEPETPDSDATVDDSAAVPSKLRITQTTDSVTLSWSPISDATSYNVFYSEIGTADETSQSFSSSNTSFSHEGLAMNVHNYKVQAVFSDQNTLSALSSPLTADLSNQVIVQD